MGRRISTNTRQELVESSKLLSKTRQGAKVKRAYDRPRTPCERLVNHPAVQNDTKEILRELRLQLDPVAILHRLRDAQAALAALVSTDSIVEGPVERHSISFLRSFHNCGDLAKFARLTVPIRLNHGIGEPERIRSRTSDWKS